MLEGVLEQLLSLYLLPYVDGISRDRLHFGVLRGNLELTNLGVQGDALIKLGLEGYKVVKGSIGAIKLKIPWRQLYTGKLMASVSGLSLVVESVAAEQSEEEQAKLVAWLREAKRKAIEIRMFYLDDLLRQREAEEAEHGASSSHRRGTGVKLVRKILHNITIHLSDVKIALVNPHRGFACEIGFNSLSVLSTDETFRERDEREHLVVNSTTMYKLLRLEGLSMKMSPAGNADLDAAEYIVSPLNASLQLAHVPNESLVRLRLEVATEELLEVLLRRSNVKHVRGVRAETQREKQALFRRMVPLAIEEQLFADPERARDEYKRLYERQLIEELKAHGQYDFLDTYEGNHAPLREDDKMRLQLLEDAFSIRFLAVARLKVRSKLEALNQEFVRRQMEADEEKKGIMSWFVGRIRKDPTASEQSNGETGADSLLSSADRALLMEDLEDESKVESVNLPQRFQFEFVLGKMAVDLIDDQWHDEVRRQLLSLALKDAEWNIEVRMATDHKGQDSAEWRIVLAMGAFHAFHRTEAFFTFCPPPDDPDRWMASIGHIQPLVDSSSNAAKLVIENSLMPDMSLLSLNFDFNPVQIHFLPGIVEYVLEFWRSPVAIVAEPEVKVDDLEKEDFKDMAKQFFEVHADEVITVGERVYERIPDRIQINVLIHSPILHVPVVGLGTSILSLGMLSIKTEPCSYSSIDLFWRLDNTAVTAKTLRGERFDMIQPVPVTMVMEYRGGEEENKMTLQIKAEELVLAASPQALQILFATPGSLVGIMYAVPSPVAPVPVSAESTVQPTMAQHAEDLALRYLPDKMRDRGEDLKRKVEQVRKKQFRLNLEVQWEALDLTVSDAILPVLRLRMELMHPGFVWYQQSVDYCMQLNILNSSLELDVLNPLTGTWEPLAERCHVAIEVNRWVAEEATQRRGSRIVISGHEPLLLNFKPGMLRRAADMMPLVIESVTSSELLKPRDTRVGSPEVVKYRVINLTGKSLELQFKSKHRAELCKTVAPTGSTWEPLDQWVLPHFATAIAVKLLDDKRSSELLSLERIGAVAVPGSAFVAELLTPDNSHRLLLLATPLRIHNLTDLKICIRFYDSRKKEVPTTEKMLCDAALIGHPRQDYAAYSDIGKNAAQSLGGEVPQVVSDGIILQLAPNSVCAVPAQAIVGGRAAAVGISSSTMKTTISVKPALGGANFSAPFVVEGSNYFTIDCQLGIGASHNQPAVHLLLEPSSLVHAMPFTTVITTISLQPPLALLNALPNFGMAVRYAVPHEISSTKSESSFANLFGSQTTAERLGLKAWSNLRWFEVKVAPLTQINVYNLTDIRNGIALKARLGSDGPWSQVLTFDKESLKESDNLQTVQIWQHDKGAPACLSVEPLNTISVLRLSCPNWFVDRSGLQSQGVEVHYGGAALPRQGGITLLPSDVLEKSCELVIKPSGVRTERVVSKTVRLPPSWTVFTWKAGSAGNQVFCVQSEDVAPDDVLGAHCQVMTLRPRLVITNGSVVNVEVRLEYSKVMLLSPGQSKDHHWSVGSGEEEHPSTSVKFRPVLSPPCEWSGEVICSDRAAGSTPFVLPNAETAAPTVQRGSLGVLVWSAEVAPLNGAIAVTFREGSDFVVVNQCTEKPTKVTIRPFGTDDVVANVVAPFGQEVPFGWMRPFKEKQKLGVDVTVDKTKVQIEDVRQTVRVARKSVAVSLSRDGTRTLLTITDSDSGALVSAPSSGNLELAAASTSGNAGDQSSQVILQLDIRISQVGISLIEEEPVPRDLLYLHLDLLRFTFQKMKSDVRCFFLAISEAQVDCQLPGRVDANMDEQRDDLRLRRHDKQGVILANCAAGDQAFLTVALERGASGSRNILLHRAEVTLDALDITIDDEWLNALVYWLTRAKAHDGRGKSRVSQGLPLKQVQDMAGKSVLEDYVAPALPQVIQVEQMRINGLSWNLWCNLKLKTVRFLPQYIRTAIRVLSFSGQFTLDDANLLLPARQIPPHRGSLKDFVKGLRDEYMLELINNAALMLGKSSLLNLPRVPLQFGSTIFSYITDSVGLAAGEAASLMAQLTFDDEYIARQRCIRESKRINGLSDGVVEAGKSLAQGIEGCGDICSKPFEGARRDGCSGCVTGVGLGLAGTFVKPISKVGQAISDVGAGVAAQVAPETASMRRRCGRTRCRLPRLLFTTAGAVRTWSELEALVLQQLGPDVTAGVEEVLPLTAEKENRRTVMLLFSRRILIARIVMPENNAQKGGGALLRGVQAGRGENLRRAADDCNLEEDIVPVISDKVEPIDLLDALDESALKIVSQVLKPINSLVYGMRDMEAKLVGKTDDSLRSGDTKALKEAREISFSDLQEVRMVLNNVLQLIPLRGGPLNLSLGLAPFGEEAGRALALGLKNAVNNPSRSANWDKLRTALLEEQRAHRRSLYEKRKERLKLMRRQTAGAGTRILEVFEVERRFVPTGEWKTPFLPMERDFSWRWVDATGARHPHLRPLLKREDACRAREPPCDLSALFTAKSGWSVEVGTHTDAEGWRYGLAWNASTWDTKPGLFDCIRKRRWTKKYE